MKIAVMAGTPIDTKMGEELLKKNGYTDIISIAISNSPVEQTTFQSLNTKTKEKVIIDYLKKLIKNNCNVVFVYCNSLSSAVDFDKLGKEYNIRIITPMQMYRNLALEYNYLAVMAANAHGLVGVENNLYIANPGLRVLGLSMLELVKSIEHQKLPMEIINDFNFEQLLNYFKLTGVQAIVLGCTHFPYIKEELEKITGLPIIDVGVYMLKQIEKEI